ncbi:hypothetical protein OHD62_16225 [Mesorhizobium sp. YC-39]|uniref:hypothetical protein n=1 Tax=unclassified Mesorhizobium TaxID=325217 RepID=UPI0021E97AB1|nr:MULTISPECIES: hypothetical protein [unclassified Mesorhizobium]MCV3208190.1 hypothetical protein [Mesorhizobium sp. YC-2]MCV3229917.1 hypothetical protein [Mesorhizobium sp. YC-39]
MQFRNETDEYFADGLERFGSRYDVVREPELGPIYNRLLAKYGKVFDLKPVVCRPMDGIDVEPYRTQGHPFFLLFYAIMKDQIGRPLYVITELHGQLSYPDAIFELESSIGLSLAHADKGGVDHICFKEDLEFLIVRDRNDIVTGYGKAAAWLRAFRKFYPEFVV